MIHIHEEVARCLLCYDAPCGEKVARAYEMVARALEAGWGGVFYKTITKADIQEVSPRFDAVRKEGTPFVGFRNMEQLSENPYTVELNFSCPQMKLTGLGSDIGQNDELICKSEVLRS